MGLTAIRRVALPGARKAPSTFVTVLLMAAVALGLVAMHDSGSEHVAHAVVSESADSHVRPHGEGDAVPPAASMSAVVAGVAAVVADCGGTCVADLLGCAAAAMACAMMIALVILLTLASRPAMFKRVLDAGATIPIVVREVTGHLRPNLHVLSISRT